MSLDLFDHKLSLFLQMLNAKLANFPVDSANCHKTAFAAFLFTKLLWNIFYVFSPDFQPALEGRAIVNLQMSNTFAAFQDISASVAVKPTAELLTNRGVIYQVWPRVLFHRVHNMSSWLKTCGKFVCCNFDSDDPIGWQFCTCHDSSAVVTSAKLWLDWVIIFHGDTVIVWSC